MSKCPCERIQEYIDSTECKTNCSIEDFNPFIDNEDDDPEIERFGITSNRGFSNDCTVALKIIFVNEKGKFWFTYLWFQILINISDEIKTHSLRLVRNKRRRISMKKGHKALAIRNDGNCCWNLYQRPAFKGMPIHLKSYELVEKFIFESIRMADC